MKSKGDQRNVIKWIGRSEKRRGKQNGKEGQ